MNDELPGFDVDTSKRILAAAIGAELSEIVQATAALITRLDVLRRKAGFVNGLKDACAGARGNLEAASQTLVAEIADVAKALQEKPAPASTVDPEHIEAVKDAKRKSA